MLDLTFEMRKAWTIFFNNSHNSGHASRGVEHDILTDKVNASYASSLDTANRIKSDLNNIKPMTILEVGCSAGLNCMALRAIYPFAKVIGIEPEKEAIDVANAMTVNDSHVTFIQGVGENIPLDDSSVDLIVCHTVIEHVNDVSKVIRDFSRVLKPGGIIHLEAPNYVWPYEPHLHIWTIPLLGKKFVKFTALLQGKKNLISFLEHLKFVTPNQLEKHFLRNDLQWENKVETKLLKAVSTQADIKRYKFISPVLKAMKIVGLETMMIKTILKLGLYPSVMYILTKKQA